ncbi:MAG: hypothetical protein E4G99_01580 [Anaerolineales bacterium]|nr:MAG: hypothetical protein E4G99_01580 [Anaerolineales bacterium]
MFGRLLAAIRKDIFIAFQIALLFTVGFTLRFVNLGYSNLQGDEIRIICRPSNFNTIVQFLGYLLGQREGPAEYIITCGLGLIDPTFSSEFFVRLPFATANMIALLCLFILVWRLFNINVAIFAGFLFASNGIFVGQARFAQYQSIVQLGVTAGLMGLVLAIRDVRWRVSGLYLGFLAAAGALLSHFDGVFVLPPMALLVLHWWTKYKGLPEFPQLRKHLFAAVGLYSLLVFTFYIEYVNRLDTTRLSYWGTRFVSNPTDTLNFFTYFNPGLIPWIYLIAVILAFTRLRRSVGWQVILVWLIPPLVFMELIFKDSRASAYDYILPLILLAGLGFSTLLDWFRHRVQIRAIQTVQAGILILVLGFAFISFQLFVDHESEYPWQPKTVLGMEVTGGYLNGLFGVPYNRDWRAIGAWFERSAEKTQIVATNEKLIISQFYLPSSVKYKYIYRDSLQERPVEEGIYILMVENPQSWMDQLWGWTSAQWSENLTPEHEFVNEEGTIVASLYFLTQGQIDAEFHW